MKSLVKKYLPYGLVILAVYLITPLFFMGADKKNITPVLYYFIFLLLLSGRIQPVLDYSACAVSCSGNLRTVPRRPCFRRGTT